MEADKQTVKEEDELHQHIVAASSLDYQDLPIMHWEELNQRIAELEKQKRERRDSLSVRKHFPQASASLPFIGKRRMVRRMEEGGMWTNIWEEEDEDLRRCWVTAVTSRFHDHRNLQLCFINNSDSEDEEGSDKKATGGRGGGGGAGLKQEVAAALRTLRDKLLAEQKEEEEHLAASSSSVAKRKHLELWELQQCSRQQLSSFASSLQQQIHALSSELVAHLLLRDQLRTRQDAMLLDVQDLT
ncbi:schwannomin-interacting protein 1-like isoform X2 [Betta splendens]|uniref:Schwannomin-interacting protein 1-like isoform X2 n=1 Tax=Betta splendens TaxID=158456 RepID=A0A9W2X8N1_BETSP|nr:schwannomin-interacting protein 1-like isoform X2 [Betta splendens]